MGKFGHAVPDQRAPGRGGSLKPDVRDLLDKAAENVRAAHLLQQNDFRNIAASRAYYALFYVAEALLLEIGMAYSSHAAVVAAYGRQFAKTGMLDPRFHRHLIDAQDLRHFGDYGGGPGATHEQVEQALEWAEDFLADAEQYLAAED